MSSYRPQITRVESGGSAASKIKAGKELMQQDRLEDALAQFEAGVKAEPNDRKAHLFCAGVLAKLKRWDESIAHCEEVHRIDPMNVQAHLRHARVLLAKREMDAALKEVDTVLQLDAQSTLAYFMRGYIAFSKHDFEAARNAYAKALLLNPRMVRARIELARVLMAESKSTEALSQLGAATRIEPENGLVKEALGRIHVLAGDHAAAMDAYEQAFALGRQESGEANMGYAEAAIALGKFEEAEKRLRKAEDKAKSRMRLQRIWGDLAYGREFYSDAVDQYRAALLLASSGGDLESQLLETTPAADDPAGLKAMADELRGKLGELRMKEELETSAPDVED